MAIPLDKFVRQLEDTGIISGETLKDYIPPKGTSQDAESLARELVRKKQLTRYQAEEVYRGKGKALVLGNYVLMEKIGAGGMGQVFKACHRRMERIVAIKLLPPELTKDPDAIARFSREVKAAAKISHPNIVASFDADCADKVHFLVMEFVEGSDLSAHIKKHGTLSLGKAINYILQAARGLDAAHKKGVFHRDIKPANLLLDAEGTVKILDMGLARISGEIDAPQQAELTTTGTIMGTVDYMAPEQAVNTKTADGRADIYALGCTLHYLLCGQPTYGGDTLMARLLAHRDQPIPSLRAANPDVPDELEAVFRKMVAKRVEDRYQSMAELLPDLEKCSHGNDPTVIVRTPKETTDEYDMMSFLREPTLATTKPVVRPLAPKQPPSPPNKLLLGGGILGALVLLAGIIVSLKTKDGTLVVEVDQPDAMVQLLDEQGQIEVSQKGGGGKITFSVDPGKHRLKVVKDGFTTYGQEFEMENNGKKEITAKLVPLKAVVGTQPAPVAGVKKPLAYLTPGFDEWVKDVAAMPAEQQVEAVSTKLMELNPGFDGKFESRYLNFPTPQVENGVVKSLVFCTDTVNDISPVRALTELKALYCFGSQPGKGHLSDLSQLKGASLEALGISNNPVKDLSPLHGMSLKHFHMGSTQVSDISPLRGMPITVLLMVGAPVSDLSPLQGMKLEVLICASANAVSDLSPLKGMPLAILQIEWTNVTDLSPLQGMPLTSLNIAGNAVKDLSPLKDLPLTDLHMEQMQYIDRSPLKALALKLIALDFQPERDTELLRSIKTLETINEKPVAEFWKALETHPSGKQPLAYRLPGFEEWVNSVTAFPAEQQVEAVAKKLVELNPGFDGKVTHEIVNGAVYKIVFDSVEVTDLSPLRTLVGLCVVDMRSSRANGMLMDLSPLQSLALTSLICSGTCVSDLSPLSGLPLQYIDCWNTHVSDLSPLSGMQLTGFSCQRTPVSDLSPLKGMPIGYLNIQLTQVTDLSPLAGMPLTLLLFDFQPKRDTELLRSIPTLTQFNLQTADEFWKDYSEWSDPSLTIADPAFLQWMKETSSVAAEAQVVAVTKKLQELNPSFDGQVEHQIEGGVVTSLKFVSDKVWNIAPVRALSGLKSFDCSGSKLNGREGKVVDLSPLTGMSLTDLKCVGNLVFDLSPLRGMPLTKLDYGSAPGFDMTPLQGMPLTWLNWSLTPLSDFSPLKGLQLQYLQFDGAFVTDLTPIRGMPITQLSMREAHVTDLSPVAGMPLDLLGVQGTNLTDPSSIRNLPIKYLFLDYHPARDAAWLRSMTTLEYINEKPVAEFWQSAPAPAP